MAASLPLVATSGLFCDAAAEVARWAVSVVLTVTSGPYGSRLSGSVVGFLTVMAEVCSDSHKGRPSATLPCFFYTYQHK